MPHKKPRNIASLEEPTFELAPTEYNTRIKTSKKRKSASGQKDDTPKEFLRLMSVATGKKKMNALDNGDQVKPKKRKPNPQTVAKKAEGAAGDKDGKEGEVKELKPTSNKFSNPMPYRTETDTARSEIKIQPGESLKAFARRVDQSLPVHLKTRETHPAHLKKMKRRQKLLAEEEERRKKKQEEEDSDDYDPEEADPFEEVNALKKKKRGARSPSPFAELRQKREKIPFGEVVQAPPDLIKFKPKFKSVMDVPKASGSLAKRSELAEERMSIVEQYRKMMEKKRSGGIGSLVQQ
ncbi:hypothetical protein BJ508DRAFT_410700 [Ascobolus immersus RN42]|uniref:Uncharacterized protein n=1 Tax=Ascobolus immersus RN42 TaxID=1160509 RepID=A0A3N4ILZ8_ASCIM|nr:hypothetical protein BJ508DRAFT_410700 [Ascobolus immersus RN42]